MGNSKWIQVRKNKNKMCPFLSQKIYNDSRLKLDCSEIPVVDEYKFLEIIFDKNKHSFPHLKYLKTECYKILQLLHMIAHKEGGADRNTLLLLYRSLIRSELDYGNSIYPIN